MDSNNGLMERLKESTRAMHDSAEHSQFQGHLANGELPQKLYADYLEQLYLIHSFMESEFNKHSKSGAKFAGVVTSEQLQEPFLRQDLAEFKRDPQNIKPVPTTEKLLNEIKELSSSCPVALLGMHYVLLGSKHGGKFIAKTCQEKYDLTDAGGVVYFNPYGQNFMPLWLAFKQSMNDLQLSDLEADKTCEAAGKMFMAVSEIGAELMPLARL